MIRRTAAALSFISFLLLLDVGGATAGTRGYDIGALLDEQHPFATNAPLRPVIAAPVPAAQIRAPARVPQPTSQYRPAVRPAAERTASQRVPAATAQRMAAAPAAAPREGLGGILSEVRFGILAHDIGPFSSNEESGIDGNFEMLFVSPGFLDLIWSPRPHLGFSINSGGDTSQVYAGLTWEWSFWKNWFAGFSLGGSVHDGKKTTNRIDRKELGCRLLFRESIEVGYRFGGRHAISGFLDHISNANICDKNEGLETTGIRYGYKF